MPFSAAAASVGNHQVIVHTGNGHGSTNTTIRRFTTTLLSVGSAITYADSATDGASFTINQAGVYGVFYNDVAASGSVRIGSSLNSAELTTVFGSIAIGARVAVGAADNGNFVSQSFNVLVLAVGDVVRPHTNGGPVNVSDSVYFSIKKIAL